MLADKVCLIILDDVWSMEQVEPFRDALGPRCRLLVTTRDGSLVTALGAEEHRVDVLSNGQALALLAEWSGGVREMLAEGARQIAEECGNLPLALALCGAMARDGTSWPDLVEALRETDLTFIEARLPNYPFSNVLRAIRLSVDVLGQEDPVAAERYHELVVFPQKAVVPEAALWCRDKALSERKARRLLTNMGRKALLTLQGDSPHRRLSLHDLQYDYLRAVAGDGISTLQRTLVDAYRSKCPAGWASGPDDGYFFQFLPTHLAAAGHFEELTPLLGSYNWIEAKLKATDLQSLIADYERVPGGNSDLTLVQRAFRLSAVALARDPMHLSAQLIGRLNGVDRTVIRAILASAARGPDAPWLCPKSPSLVPPGQLVRAFVGHTRRVNAVAVLPDGRRALSGSHDNTLRLWDLETGESRALARPGVVHAVAVLPDGRRALSGSHDNTLRLWDLETGKSRALAGHTDDVTAVAVLPDGRRALSGSWDNTLRLWDLETGESRALAGHTGRLTAVAVLPDGRRALSSSWDNTLRLWDLETGESRALVGHTGPVTAVAVLPDGRRALSGSLDKTLRLWDLETGESRALAGHTAGSMRWRCCPTAGARCPALQTGPSYCGIWRLPIRSPPS